MVEVKWEKTTRSGLYKRSDGAKWKCTYYIGGRQLTKNFDLKRQAEDFLADHRQQKKTGAAVDPRKGRISLDELYELVHEDVTYAPATLALHAVVWRQSTLDSIRKRAIGKLAENPGEIATALRRIERPAMREKSRLVLSALFTWAMEPKRRWVASNPTRPETRPKTRAERKERRGTTSNGSKRNLSADELARLLEATPDRYRTLVHTLARVGLRPGEGVALTVGKLDPMRRVLRVDTAASGDTKSGEAREILLPAAIVEELVEHIAAWSDPKDPEALIFPTSRGTMFSVDQFRHLFARAAKKADVNGGITPHALRHSAVSWAIGLGADVYYVQKMVGHARASTTLDIYGSAWEARHTQVAELMDRAIREEAAAVPTDAQVVRIR